jgi:hypothetical protein
VHAEGAYRPVDVGVTAPALHAAPLPPQSLDAEESVLGAALISGTAQSKVIERVLETDLTATDFYRESHGHIFRAILALYAKSEPFDAITVVEELSRSERLEKAGGPQRIHELAAIVPAAANAGHYARIVVEKARQRQLIKVGNDIARLGWDAPAEIDELERQAEELVDQIATRTSADDRISFVPLTDFVTRNDDTSEPAIGSVGNVLLPFGGLVIVGGEGGASKTTFTVDAVAHICSGTPWHNFPIDRPLRTLLIENEGSRSEFRKKLQDKIAAWDGQPFADNVVVLEEPWASFTFTNPHHVRALRDFAHTNEVDLVVADPLDSLGVEGAGKPEETRGFIRRLKDCGLHNPDQPLAFWLLHHFNKIGHKNVVQQLSGAWGGHPDTILGIEMGDAQTTKLTWAKLRWATPPKEKTVILHWDIPTRGFTVVDQKFSIAELRNDVLSYVTANPGHATSRIQKQVVGGNEHIREALEWLACDQGGNKVATGPGERKNGKYWYPNIQAVLDLATDNLAGTGDRGEHTHSATLDEVLATDRLARSGEHGEVPSPDPQNMLGEDLATTPSPCKGEGDGGGEDEAVDHHLSTTPGDNPASTDLEW